MHIDFEICAHGAKWSLEHKIAIFTLRRTNPVALQLLVTLFSPVSWFYLCIQFLRSGYVPLFSHRDLHVSILGRRFSAALQPKSPDHKAASRWCCLTLSLTGAAHISHSHVLGARVYPQGHPIPEKEGSHPRPEKGSAGSQLPPEPEGSHPRRGKLNWLLALPFSWRGWLRSFSGGNPLPALPHEKEESIPPWEIGSTGSRLPPEQEGSHPRPEKGSTGSQLPPEQEGSYPRPEKGSAGAGSQVPPKKGWSQLPPQQEDIKVNRWEVLGSQEVLTSLSCCDWMQCLRVCKGARNLVRDHVSQVMVGLPALPSGWTVPLDILRIRTNGQGKCVLLAPDYGVSIESPSGVPGEDVEGLTAILIPPSASGFLTVGTQDFFACSPILRCTWKRMAPHPNVPWTVRFPIDEETGSCTTPGDIGILRRSFDSPEGEWQELNMEIRPESMRAGVEFEVPHFSDIQPAVRRATLSGHNQVYFKRRRPIFSITTWTSMARIVRVYNASPAELSFLQVSPSQVIVERSDGVTANVPLVGGGAQRGTTYTPPRRVQEVITLGAYQPNNPWFIDLHPVPTAKSMRLAVYTTNDARREVTYRGMIDECRVGTDVILLDGMQNKTTSFGTRSIASDSDAVCTLLKMLKDLL